MQASKNVDSFCIFFGLFSQLLHLYLVPFHAPKPHLASRNEVFSRTVCFFLPFDKPDLRWDSRIFLALFPLSTPAEKDLPFFSSSLQLLMALFPLCLFCTRIEEKSSLLARCRRRKFFTGGLRGPAWILSLKRCFRYLESDNDQPRRHHKKK